MKANSITTALLVVAVMIAGIWFGYSSANRQRYEFHDASDVNKVAIWRCNICTGQVSLGALDPISGKFHWKELP